jgi:RimJ/RimL family protein N-acetyltransferase
MNLLIGHDAAVASFVARLIPDCTENSFKENTAAIGVINADGVLIGGIVYHNYLPEYGTVEVSAAATDARWLNRKTLYGLFRYPFLLLNCQLVMVRMFASNARTIKVQKAYGFKHYTIPRLYGRDMDCVVGTLTIEDWKANGFHKENTA